MTFNHKNRRVLPVCFWVCLMFVAACFACDVRILIVCFKYKSGWGFLARCALMWEFLRVCLLYGLGFSRLFLRVGFRSFPLAPPWEELSNGVRLRWVMGSTEKEGRKLKPRIVAHPLYPPPREGADESPANARCVANRGPSGTDETSVKPSVTPPRFPVRGGFQRGCRERASGRC